MKNLPAVLVLLVVGIADVHAQFFAADEITSNPFAMTYGVDPQLTLFVPDTGTQILFNPARAMKYQRQFVVGKYDGYPMFPVYSFWNNILFEETENNYRVTIERLLPPVSYSYTPSPTVDVAVLKKDEDSYWLFHLTNITNASNSDYTSSLTRNVSPTQQNTSSTTENYDVSFSKTRFKVSRIFDFGGKSYSYSLFGYYLPNSNNVTRKYYSDSREDYTSSQRTIKMTNFNETKYVQPKYSLGVEMSIVDDVSDLILSIHAVRGKEENLNNSATDNESLIRYTSDTNSNSTNYNRNLLEYSSTSDPTTVIVYGFYHRPIAFFGVHTDAFVSVTGSYLSGENNIFATRKIYNYYRYGSSTPFGDTVVVESRGDVERTNYGLTASMGALPTFDFDDLQLQTGLVSQINYSTSTFGQLSYGYYPEQYLRKDDISYYRFSILLPVMVTYSPAEWCTLFSGMNIRYVVYLYDSKYKSIPLTVTYSKPSSYISQTTQASGSSSYSSYSSASSLFFNMQLHHKSGFKVQLSFKEDITRYRELGLSLMYFF